MVDCYWLIGVGGIMTILHYIETQLRSYSVLFRHIDTLKPAKYLPCHATKTTFVRNVNTQSCDGFP